MNFSTYFIIISYLMAAAGLLAVSLTEVINPLFLTAISGVTILSLLLSIKGKPFNIPGFIWNSIAVIILTAALMDYLFVSRSLADVSVRFLTILMVAKLFDLRTNRDYAILYILTFFQLLAASASTINISFLLVLALYILTGIWALTIFTLKKDWEEKKGLHKEPSKNILGPYFFIATAGLAALSLLITLSLFFIIPRMGVGFFSRQTADTVKVSGFSEKVDLGDIGPIKLDPTIMMRVELPGGKTPPLSRLYFRGMSFDIYDNAQWQQTIKEKTLLKRDGSGIWRVKQQMAGSEDILTQTILLEPIETNVIFAASYGIGVSGNFRNVLADSAGSFHLPSPSYSRVEYTAYSVLSPPPKAIFPEQDYLTGIEPQYLQVSSGLEMVYGLAKDITADKKTPFEKAAKIEEYLKRNYRYTLTPGKGEGKNPVEDFLFYTKEGYCEQYATAMTLMLRAIGIPSRLVTGFLPGEWNKFGNYLIIRQRDAHSWVEAYMPESGWATFDPTPPAEAVGAAPPQTSIITLYFDSLKWRWSRYIINYSLRDQINFAKAFEAKGRSMASKLRWETFGNQFKAVEGYKREILILMTLSLMVLLALLIVIIRIVRKRAEKAIWHKTPLFYKTMLMFLEKKGKIKKNNETALEFARSINIKEVNVITDIYYKVRFGKHKLKNNEKDKISAYLAVIKKGSLRAT